MFTVFEAGGVQYRIRYTTNSVCELERAAGCGLPALMDKGEVSAVRLLLWAGLLHEGGVTLERAGELMDCAIAESGSLHALCDILRSALERAGFIPPGELPGAGSPQA